MKNTKKILVVEDDDDIREVITLSLPKNKFTVLEAKNGKEGLDMALSEHPDLILLDLLMPVMDGMTALKNIRQDAWGANVSVIILTNLNATDENTIKDMVTNKPLYYLIKSNWKIADVVKKIEEILAVQPAAQ
jgi:CheY-like chemotaxis protein